MLKLKKLDYWRLRRNHTLELALTELSPSKIQNKKGEWKLNLPSAKQE